MPKTAVISTNFTSGELSPLLDGRVDLSKYYNGAKQLENFITVPTGGAKRRPGTYYVASVKTAAKLTRLVPFQFSTTQSYNIEFGDLYLRFYMNRGQILSPDTYTKLLLHGDGTDGSPNFIDETGKTMTAAGTAEIDTAQYKFGNASGFFQDGHISTPDHADWNFGSGDFTIDSQVRLLALPGAGNYMVICGQYADVNNQWRLYLYNNSGTYQWKFLVNETTTIIDWAVNSNSLSTLTWYHIALVRNGNNFMVFQEGVQQGATQVDASAMPDITSVLYIGRIPGLELFQGWLDEFRISKGIARWTANFTPPTSEEDLLGDPYEIATPFVESHLFDLQFAQDADTMWITHPNYKPRKLTRTGHTAWTLSSYAPTADVFTSADNYPSCVTIHEQRIFFANTNNDPQKVWASVSGNFEDMTTGTGNSAALVYTIGSEQVNAIRWLSSGRALGMGTLGGIFSMGSGSDELAITPTNVVVKRETTFGSLGIVPKKIGNQVYYIQRNAKILREFGYVYDINEYASKNVTELAEHITGDAIVDMDYQQSPYNILWCVRSDGVVCTLTRLKEEEVASWTRQKLGGSFGSGGAVVESVAVIPGDGGDDEVWFIVKRTINSATVRYVEYLKPMDFGDEQEDAFFVDCGLSLDSPKVITGLTKANPGVVTAVSHGFSNGNIVIIRGVVGMTEVNRTKFKVAAAGVNTFELTDAVTGVNINTSSYTTYVSGGEVRKCVTSVSGLSHLEGASVKLFIDGISRGSATVSGAAITITDPANGGGEIHAGLQQTPTIKTMRIEAGSAQGTAQNKLKRISKVAVRVHETLGMNVGNEDTQDAVSFDATNSFISLFSGDKEIVMPSLWDRNAYVVINQTDPVPLTIVAIITYLVTEDA